MMQGSIIGFGSHALFNECHHNTPSILHACTYCFVCAAAFVGGLFILVPARVRTLERDDPLQIQWRTFATSTICILAIAVYPFCFCADDDDSATNLSAMLSSSSSSSSLNKKPVLELIGIYSSGSTWILFGALFHSMVLYLGPFVMLLLQVHQIARSSPKKDTFANVFYAVIVQPRASMLMSKSNPQSKAEKWIFIRSIVAAPILEELVFRGCIVPPLLQTHKFHPWTVAWLAPVFFGLAHCHHALLKLKQGEPLNRVLLTTTFQFIYTSLFGAYAAHAFIRSGSIIAVILSHSFCNSMGLPSLHFFSKASSMYPYRGVLLAVHVLGIVFFAWGFATSIFLPLPSEDTTLQFQGR